MTVTITRHFLPLAGGRQIHYRRAGSGPPLVLMHPSPNSSASLVPQIKAFADTFTCIALDTPGFGLSDDIVADAAELWGYADALAQALDALGIARTAVYGAATGAQIGIQFARRYPRRAALLMLDANGDFSGDLHHVADGYFQDISPVRDGTHLLRIWDMCRHLSVFFPWQSDRDADRLDAPTAPPDVIQSHVNDYLRAGPGYKRAYYEAMVVERFETTSAVTVPVLMTRNAASPLLRHTDALIAKGLPANFRVLPCDPATRFAVLRDAARAHFSTVDALPAPPPPPRDLAADGSGAGNFYLKAGGGQLRARGALSGAGRPLVALHDPAGSSRLVEPIVAPFIGSRPVIAVDLPGNGESDAIIGADGISAVTYADIVLEGLRNAGLDGADVIGRYSGGCVAIEMSLAAPAVVRRLVLSGIGHYTGAERADLLAHYTPSIAPEWDGSHLVRAWAMMRDQNLFWPWYNRTRAGRLRLDHALDVKMIHLRVCELLKTGDRYRNAYAAMWTYDMPERLGRVRAPVLLGAPAWDPAAARTAACAGMCPGASSTVLPPRLGDWAPALAPFLAQG